MSYHQAQLDRMGLLARLDAVLEEFARCGADRMDGEAQETVVDALRYFESIAGRQHESRTVLLGEARCDEAPALDAGEATDA